MTVIFHPEFPNDIRKFESSYAEISSGLAARFRGEIDSAIAAVKTSPQSTSPAMFAVAAPHFAPPTPQNAEREKRSRVLAKSVFIRG